MLLLLYNYAFITTQQKPSPTLPEGDPPPIPLGGKMVSGYLRVKLTVRN